MVGCLLGLPPDQYQIVSAAWLTWCKSVKYSVATKVLSFVFYVCSGPCRRSTPPNNVLSSDTVTSCGQDTHCLHCALLHNATEARDDKLEHWQGGAVWKHGSQWNSKRFFSRKQATLHTIAEMNRPFGAIWEKKHLYINTFLPSMFYSWVTHGNKHAAPNT